MIFALLVTPAAADDYRGFKDAYVGVPWPKSVTSIEQCQKQVAEIVRQLGFTDAELKPSRWTRDTDLWVKDKKNHFDIGFGCDQSKKVITIDVDSWQGQKGSARILAKHLLFASRALAKAMFTRKAIMSGRNSSTKFIIECFNERHQKPSFRRVGG